MGLSLEMHGASELAAKLREQAKRAKAPTPALRVAAVELESLVQNSFDNQGSPAGEPWPPLAPSTIRKRAFSRGGRRRKLRKGSRGYNVGVDLGLNAKAARNLTNLKILQDTARGKNATSVKASGTRIQFRNNTLYMGVHLRGLALPLRRWAPFVWTGGRFVFDDRGAGGQWMISARGRVTRYIVRGEA